VSAFCHRYFDLTGYGQPHAGHRLTPADAPPCIRPKAVLAAALLSKEICCGLARYALYSQSFVEVGQLWQAERLPQERGLRGAMGRSLLHLARVKDVWPILR
jgi:hypothetical protein